MSDDDIVVDDIVGDGKDWTWVLHTPCPECGYVAEAVRPAEVGRWIRENAESWARVLADSRGVGRPAPSVWSPTEYGCHVRDVHRVFAGRVRLMLAEPDPRFPDWDQDAAAAADGYRTQDAAHVIPELLAAAADVAHVYDGVRPDQWARRGVRSNGSEFTVDSIARYHLHDVVHHLHDVRPAG